MTTYQFFTTAWTWNSIVFILSAVASVGYFLAFGRRGRLLYFAAAVVVFLLAFISLSLQRAHAPAHSARAHRSRTVGVKSTAIVFASFSIRLFYSSTDRMDWRSWCDVALARARPL